MKKISFKLISVLSIMLISVALIFVGAFGFAACVNGKHTITVITEEGVSGVAPVFDDVKEGKTITLPENTFTKDGYDFKGWSDGNGTYQPGDSYTVGDSDIIFTPVWEASGSNNSGKNILVSFSLGDGVKGEPPTTINVKVGESITLPTASLTKEGYVFVGWSDGVNTYKIGNTYIIQSSSVTFTAIWKVSTNYFGVSFIGGEGATGDAPTMSA